MAVSVGADCSSVGPTTSLWCIQKFLTCDCFPFQSAHTKLRLTNVIHLVDTTSPSHFAMKLLPLYGVLAWSRKSKEQSFGQYPQHAVLCARSRPRNLLIWYYTRVTIICSHRRLELGRSSYCSGTCI